MNKNYYFEANGKDYLRIENIVKQDIESIINSEIYC